MIETRSTADEYPSFPPKKVRHSRGQWSTRLLILALIGIFFLTLFPFQFNFHATLPNGKPPFLLGTSEKPAGPLHHFLNVLLFVPFGFAVFQKLRDRGKSLVTIAIWALALGALLSYMIEFLQIYIPLRDSGWDDVLTNATGSLLGSLLFGIFGAQFLNVLSTGESAFVSLLGWPRSSIFLAVYFAFWVLFSIPLQQQTRLNDWVPNMPLFIGNDAAQEYTNIWQGELQTLQIWDQPIGPEVVKQLTAGEDSTADRSSPVFRVDFNKAPPYHDKMNFLPGLGWGSDTQTTHTESSSHPNAIVLDGKSWLVTKGPVANLVRTLQQTNQFAIRIVCRPATTIGIEAPIVSISQPSGGADLEIVQAGVGVSFVFRNAIPLHEHEIIWTIRDVFEANQLADILFSYDGLKGTFYLNDKPAWRLYRLGPGAAPARFAGNIRAGEINSYGYIYYFLIFFTGGALAGIAARNLGRYSFAAYSFFAFVFFVPALILEFVLASIAGRSISPQLILLSIALAVAGFLWINAGRRQIEDH